MNSIRRQHSEAFKFKVAIAAIRGEKTMSELVQEFGVCESLIHKWKAHGLHNGAHVFSAHQVQSAPDRSQTEMARLHEKIGQLVIERDFLEKALHN